MSRVLCGYVATVLTTAMGVSADEPARKPIGPVTEKGTVIIREFKVDEVKPGVTGKQAQPHSIVLQLQTGQDGKLLLPANIQAQAKPVVVQLGGQTEAVQKEVEDLLKKLREHQFKAQAKEPGQPQVITLPLQIGDKKTESGTIILQLQTADTQAGSKPVAVQLKAAQDEATQKQLEEALKKLREQQDQLRKVQPPNPPPQTQNPNQEIINLLKQIIQKLEAQGGQPLLRYEFKSERPTWKRLEAVPMRPATPELEKARAALKEAEARLAEARAKLEKLQGGGDTIKVEPRQPIQPKVPFKVMLQTPAVPPGPPPAKGGDLEKRLDRLMQEVEELRKELRKGK